ncbi:hypothetical protein QC763_110650 [Podospora pseudopauciseta]|uniref:Uncharacterized protein n=2 Tax=Podospora TaxID=5144 RepID=A0ABR0HZK8_9PEZI|nr:hypothetical protein QC763_110650 [Podospora pseudopauciseta]KAK4681800.1 hypothetical protein QC764_110650 [Podospora pseudoanserina]
MKDRASDPLKVDPLKAISLSSPTRIRHQTASFKLLTKPQCSSNIQHAFTLRAEAFTPSRGV